MNPLVTLPSVTQILAAAGLTPSFDGGPLEVLERARQRGTAVHAAIEAEHYGYSADLEPEHAGYLEAYRAFVKASEHQAVASELEVIHDGLKYVGHIDRVGTVKGELAIPDWKTGSRVNKALVSYQLAGYRLAWNYLNPSQPVTRVMAVQLRSDGKFIVHNMDIEEPERIFLAAVTIWHARTASTNARKSTSATNPNPEA